MDASAQGTFLAEDGSGVDYVGMKGSDEFLSYKTLVRELQAVDASNLGCEDERCVCKEQRGALSNGARRPSNVLGFAASRCHRAVQRARWTLRRRVVSSQALLLPQPVQRAHGARTGGGGLGAEGSHLRARYPWWAPHLAPTLAYSRGAPLAHTHTQTFAGFRSDIDIERSL
jgi:hypothetical protein